MSRDYISELREIVFQDMIVLQQLLLIFASIVIMKGIFISKEGYCSGMDVI